MSKILIIAALATLSAAANAIIVETEPNNTFATANTIGPVVGTFFVDSGDLALTANDVDYFNLHVNAGSVLSVITTPLNADYVPDTVVGLFDSSASHLLLKQNDDFGDTGGSAFIYRVNTTSDFFLGISGSGVNVADGGFTGTHSQVGNYQLTVSISPQPVPEPASFAALGVGIVALVRRRRNGAKK